MTATHRRAIGAAAVVCVVIALLGAVLMAGGDLAVGSDGASLSSAGETGAQRVSQPEPAEVSPPPAIQADSAVLVDTADGRAIFEKAAETRRAIASTTKIMTALLVLEELPLGRRVTMSETAAAVGESGLWLEEGEVLTVEQLMYGLLVKSANDAAVALAEETSGSVEEFAAAMNARAAELGLRDTHFANPHGLDSARYDGAEHYSTARDLAVLASEAMKLDEFRRFVGTMEVTIPWQGHDYDRLLENRNTLMGDIPFITGVKTGYTEKAGYCLVGSGSQEGVNLISVVLGDADKEAANSDTLRLLRWGFEQYRELTLVEEGVVAARIPLPYRPEEELALETGRGLVRAVFVEDEVSRDVMVQDTLSYPVQEGEVLGRIDVSVGGEQAGTVDLVASRFVEEPSLSLRLRYWWNRLVEWISGDEPQTALQPS